MDGRMDDKENGLAALSSPMKSGLLIKASTPRLVAPLTPRSTNIMAMSPAGGLKAHARAAACTPSKATRLASCTRCADVKQQYKASQALLKAERERSRVLEVDLINTQEDCLAYQEEHDKVQQQYTELHTQGKRLHRAYVDKHQRLEEVIERTARSETALDAKVTQVESLKERLRGQDEEMSAILCSLHEKDELLSRSTSQFVALQQSHAEAMAENGHLRTQLETLQQAQQREEASGHGMVELQTALDRTQSEYTELQQEFTRRFVQQIESSALGHLMEGQQHPDGGEEETGEGILARLDRALAQLGQAAEATTPVRLTMPASPVPHLKMRPTITIDEVPRTPSPHKAVASAGTSPMAAAAAATTAPSTPTTFSVAQTMTSPRTPVVNLMALAAARTPGGLLQQLESITISNELLRDRHQALEAEIARCKAEAQTATDERQALVQQVNAERAFQQQSFDGHAAKLEDTIEALRRDLASQEESQRGAVSESMAKLCQENAELAATLEEASQRLTEREADFAEATRLYEAKLASQEALTTNLQTDLTLNYRKNKEALAVLEAKYQGGDYERRYAALLAENRALQGQADELEAACAEMEALSLLNTKACEALQAAEAAVHAREQALHTQGSELQAALGAAVEQRDAAAATVQAQAGELVDLREERDGLVDRLAGLEAAHVEAREEWEALMETQEEALRAEGETVRATLGQEQAQAEALRQRMATYAQLLAEAQASQGDAAELQGRCQEQADEIAGLNEECQALEEALHEQEERLQAALDANAASAATLETKVTVARGEAQQLEASAQGLISEKFGLESELAALQDELGVVREQLDEKTRQHSELKEFMDEERTVRHELIDDLEQNNFQAQQEVEQLQQAVVEKQEELEVVSQQGQRAVDEAREAVRAEREEIQAEVAIARARAERLSGELMEKELTVFEVQGLLESAQQRVLELETERLGAEERSSEYEQLRTYFEQYKQRAEDKIRVLQENLEKAEAEVSELDQELTKVITPPTG